jgi:hypothetical protein
MAPFDVRAVAIPPGQTRDIDTLRYKGCLVLVQGGEIELICGSGVGRRFRDGDVLWIEGLGVRRIRSHSEDQTLLVAISRPSDESAPPDPSEGGRQSEEMQK